MTYAFLFLSTLSAFLSGVARAKHHIRRDYSSGDRMRLKVDPVLYEGGSQFNQSLLWTSDWAHRQIHLQVIWLSLSGMFLAFAETEWYVKVFWAFWAYYVEGQAMKLWYHCLLPDPKREIDYDFKTWLIKLVRFW